MSNTVIKVSNLHKSFGKINAVNDLSFEVKQGEIYGFLGQNGAGKSTTIRMLLTLIEPGSGNIEVFGKSLKDNRKEILAETGAMIEKPDLYKYLSAYENLKLFARLSNIKVTKNLLTNQLQVVGLAGRANDKVKGFSQGMKQRLGIAIALVHSPKLVILDEPTNGLDPQGIADIRNLIINLSKVQGKTVLVSSHLLSEIEQIATRVLIIDKGKKVVEGSIDELIDPLNTIVEIETDSNEKAYHFLQQSIYNNRLKYYDKSVSLTIAKHDIPGLNKYLMQNGFDIYSCVQRHSLEDYFLKITSR